MKEKVSQYRLGDNVKNTVIREGKKKQFDVTLRNRHGNTQVVRDNTTLLGAEFKVITDREKEKYDINYGIKITNLGKGKLKDAGLEEGFISVRVNKEPVYDVSDFKREIENTEGGVFVEGVYANGEYGYFVLR